MTLPRIRKPPSRSTAIAGSGVTASLFQLDRCARALSPNSLVQRRISVTPTRAVPMRCRICSGSAAMPWQRSNIATAMSPELIAISQAQDRPPGRGLSRRSAE